MERFFFKWATHYLFTFNKYRSGTLMRRIDKNCHDVDNDDADDDDKDDKDEHEDDDDGSDMISKSSALKCSVI